MKKTQSDIFELNQTQFFEEITPSNNNFFLSEEVSFPTHEKFSSQQIKHLNDYDYNLLQDNAYKEIDDDLFKLEYRIARIEDEIEYLNEQIQSLEDIGDFKLVAELNRQKAFAQTELFSLLDLYKQKSMSAKVTNSFSVLFHKLLGNGMGNVHNAILNISEKFASFLPGKFGSVLELKKSLNKLENINKNVDKLIAMNIPYGESSDKYSQLSKYITKANFIQSEISKYIK